MKFAVQYLGSKDARSTGLDCSLKRVAERSPLILWKNRFRQFGSIVVGPQEFSEITWNWHRLDGRDICPARIADGHPTKNAGGEDRDKP